MGQRTKSTWLDFLTRADHTDVSLWQALTMTLSNRTRACLAESKFSPIRKRPILRALRHSKAYKNT
ncbi:hypothetical protein F383_37605 [Gossypium arboreum]|uniref:Uncharacterized protein n=1 Tax=Gossypium arboreum TaxID=29729 RepID=A0A0B0MFZ4_GOSAR|nr:hypothetical protein F383_37605 [Gossypium arboreum]